MPKDTWQNKYAIAKLNYYSGLIIMPVFFVLMLAWYYLYGNWSNLYFSIIILIPLFILMAIKFLKPRMENSKNQLIRSYPRMSDERISSYIKSALQENKIEFTIANACRGKKPPHDFIDICFESADGGLEIDIIKEVTEAKGVRVVLSHGETTSGLLINRIKDGIESGAIAPPIK